MIEVAPWVLGVVASICIAAAVGLAVPPQPRRVDVGPRQRTSSGVGTGWLLRCRWLLSLLAGTAGLSFVSGVLTIPAALALAVGVWIVIGRSEPLGVRREREEAQRDLVPLVDLIAVALAAGAPAETALSVACEALPGAASRRLAVVRAELAMGSDSERAWSSLAADEVLAPLGRAITRANRTGAPVAATVEHLARELAARSRAHTEDRARVVGVKAAVPLGVCLLPSFLLIGIVPVAAGLLDSLT